MKFRLISEIALRACVYVWSACVCVWIHSGLVNLCFLSQFSFCGWLFVLRVAMRWIAFSSARVCFPCDAKSIFLSSCALSVKDRLLRFAESWIFFFFFFYIVYLVCFFICSGSAGSNASRWIQFDSALFLLRGEGDSIQVSLCSGPAFVSAIGNSPPCNWFPLFPWWLFPRFPVLGYAFPCDIL